MIAEAATTLRFPVADEAAATLRFKSDLDAATTLRFQADPDDAAMTLRFFRVDPDATAAYDITPVPVLRLDHDEVRRRLIRSTRQTVTQLRAALAAGWAVESELAYEGQRLAALEAA